MANIKLFHSGPIVTRAEAKLEGATTYFTGKPCPHGHIAIRYTRSCDCAACTSIYRKNRRISTPSLERDKMRAWRLENGLEEKKRKRLRKESQRIKAAGRVKSNACELCWTTGTRIVFDHCHASGNFRGWLCEKCNFALGLAKDDPALLRRMADYLERNSGKVNGSAEGQTSGLFFCWSEP